jgi:hypothetical protein
MEQDSNSTNEYSSSNDDNVLLGKRKRCVKSDDDFICNKRQKVDTTTTIKDTTTTTITNSNSDESQDSKLTVSSHSLNKTSAKSQTRREILSLKKRLTPLLLIGLQMLLEHPHCAIFKAQCSIAHKSGLFTRPDNKGPLRLHPNKARMRFSTKQLC